ncbi:MAG: hypothetical protein QME49_06475 [bacterium]|nr:hypothetical protein [bacterium]
MNTELKDNLPFVTVTVSYQRQTVEVANVLIDTVSGTTLLAADIVQAIQITPSPNDTLYAIRGVGNERSSFFA